jgi:hypothetical protein
LTEGFWNVFRIVTRSTAATLRAVRGYAIGQWQRPLRPEDTEAGSERLGGEWINLGAIKKNGPRDAARFS